MKRLETEINDTNTKIAEKNQQIEEKNIEIEGLKNEIVEIEKRIEIRNELLKDRARAYQEGGGINYIDVLVGAHSFGDLIHRLVQSLRLSKQTKRLLKNIMQISRS